MPLLQRSVLKRTPLVTDLQVKYAAPEPTTESFEHLPILLVPAYSEAILAFFFWVAGGTKTF